MKHLCVLAGCLALAACGVCQDCNNGQTKDVVVADSQRQAYRVSAPEDGYQPSRGKVFHVAGRDIAEGQQIRAFFDDYQEPMHAKYLGQDVILWTYYINPDNGDIVRYCALDKYDVKSLCKLNVRFYKTYVQSADSDCL